MTTSRRDRWLRVPRPRPDAPLLLVCLPHAGGSAGAFRHWADALPGDVELVAVQYPVRLVASARIAPVAVLGRATHGMDDDQLVDQLRRLGGTDAERSTTARCARSTCRPSARTRGPSRPTSSRRGRRYCGAPWTRCSAPTTPW